MASIKFSLVEMFSELQGNLSVMMEDWKIEEKFKYDEPRLSSRDIYFYKNAILACKSMLSSYKLYMLEFVTELIEEVEKGGDYEKCLLERKMKRKKSNQTRRRLKMEYKKRK